MKEIQPVKEVVCALVICNCNGLFTYVSGSDCLYTVLSKSNYDTFAPYAQNNLISEKKSFYVVQSLNVQKS